MSENNAITDARVAEFVEIIRGFMDLRRHLKPVMPEEIARARAHLSELLPHDQEWSRHDFDLFFSVGAMLIRHQGPMTMGELSQALDVPLSTATRIVDHLVSHKYARRLPDPDDRRVVRVTLTETGTQMVQGIQSFFETRLKHIMGCFTSDEQESLLVLLRKLHKVITEEAPI